MYIYIYLLSVLGVTHYMRNNIFFYLQENIWVTLIFLSKCITLFSHLLTVRCVNMILL